MAQPLPPPLASEDELTQACSIAKLPLTTCSGKQTSGITAQVLLETYLESTIWPLCQRLLTRHDLNLDELVSSSHGDMVERPNRKLALQVKVIELCVLLIIQKLQQGDEEELWTVLLDSSTTSWNTFILYFCDLLSQSLCKLANEELCSEEPHCLDLTHSPQLCLGPEECSMMILFLTLLTDNIHIPAVRQPVFRIFGLGPWRLMSEDVRKSLLTPILTPLWERTNALCAKAEMALKNKTVDPVIDSDRYMKAFAAYQSQAFLPIWIRCILSIGEESKQLAKNLAVAERTLECFSTCLALLPVRRTLKPVFDSVQLISRLAFSPLAHRCQYFFNRLDEVDSYVVSGGKKVGSLIADRTALTHNIGKLHRFAVESQDSAFEKIRQTPYSKLASKKTLLTLLNELTVESLNKVLSHMNIHTDVASLSMLDTDDTRKIMIQVAVHHLTREATWPKRLRETALLPNEKDIWGNAELFRGLESSVSETVPFPRMGPQFLGLEDFFLRSFDLYRAEVLFGIQQDLEKTIFLMKPAEGHNDNGEAVIQFNGVSKMGIAINSFNIVNVEAPRIGCTEPSEVRGELIYDLKSIRYEDREGWDGLRQGDLVFMISLGPRSNPSIQLPESLSRLAEISNFPETYGLLGVRVCEVTDLVDREGESLLASPFAEKPSPAGTKRTLRVSLDALQYQYDVDAIGRGELFEGFYESFNLLIRRKPEANNFKGILHCLKSLALSPEPGIKALSDRLRDALLGFGDVDACNPLKSAGAKSFVAYNTFMDLDHLKESLQSTYPNITVSPGAETSGPPYQMSFIDESSSLEVQHYQISPKLRAQLELRPPVRYTEAQIKAIRSGMGEGIVLIVGPPGTGKTDTAVQIVHQLMLNHPQERILIIAKTNQALNDFFTKVVQLGIDERYLLRLGVGERELEEQQDDGTRKEFSKYGRVDHILKRRLAILGEVQMLLTSMNEPMRYAESLAQATTFLSWALRTRRAGFMDLMRRCDSSTPQAPEQKLEGLKVFLEECSKTIPWFLSLKEAVNLQRWFQASAQDREWVNKRVEDDDLVSSGGEDEDDVVEEAQMAGGDVTDIVRGELLEKLREKRRKKVEAIRARLHLLESGKAVADKVVEGKMKTVAPLVFPFQGYPFRAMDDGRSLYDCPDLDAVEALVADCYNELETLMKEAEEIRPFELLRTVVARTTYMVTNFSKIVAMTSTHAALTRDYLMNSGFRYSTLIVEEAAQILDAETVTTTLLQSSPDLKRIALLGDHLQLKPIIQNRGLLKVCNLDQSLFSRLIKLGFPYIQLDAQGRCRTELADIFRWRYKFPPLRDLPQITEKLQFRVANPALAFNFQFIDVPDGMERALHPHYYQNEIEANMVVATYAFMRMVGYPADKISVLAWYNGQKDLLKKLFKDKCQWNPLLGLPKRITTVDKFQGQQNDYVLLSLVRTKRTSYMTDMRRLTVAFSRGRLGSYTFGKFDTIKGSPNLEKFLSRSRHSQVHKLAVLPHERFGPSFTRESSAPTNPMLIQNANDLWALVRSMASQH
eukprot:Blabericola_migrator_1__809@NODE_11_length_24785_cov_110_100736_g8_i0_p1_GENE_NODE_11_length_24785_cov_110_100736_g8_i0NODE_11_length_24785_cov_110_100736_g8_i0_p1_ORF_typecomplete_len1530_score316_00Aquarius_N/PF16399_5/1_5e104AAA_11/PF13086_6/9_2e33AAA_12/PF13087_6/1_5e31AAA_30/PF13604_6/9_7e10AAA_30/PF13604_6/0_00068AAA_19/PF13245_6/3_5e03AAA_19/PF13245_6/7_2e13UvrDhelicase/PF00580_21/3_3e03UvrDhelicase/PF00580_21/8_7e08Viral_helicase1/PF01443_18/27Viral_helicase1/PF01443_18/0_00021DEAD/PF002